MRPVRWANYESRGDRDYPDGSIACSHIGGRRGVLAAPGSSRPRCSGELPAKELRSPGSGADGYHPFSTECLGRGSDGHCPSRAPKYARLPRRKDSRPRPMPRPPTPQRTAGEPGLLVLSLVTVLKKLIQL